jgi:cation:H+ antiporter
MVSKTHVLAASLGIILFAFVGLGLFLEEDIVLTPFLGLNSLMFVIIYFASLWLIYKNQKKLGSNQEPGAESSSRLGLKQIIGWYVFFACIIVVAALFLPYFAENIASSLGINKSFAGTFFLAISTSLPEIAVCIAAVRMNSTDIAVGNVLGSNIFNVFILFIDDIFYTKGHLLKDSSNGHLITVFTNMIMSAMVVVAIIYETPRKRFLLSWETSIILLIYLFNLMLLFRYG